MTRIPLEVSTASDACCADPTPVASTGACCTGPAATCGCQAPNAVATTELGRADRSAAGAASPRRLPVAVIGAGPIGLAAAAHLLEKGETPIGAGGRRGSRREHSRVGARHGSSRRGGTSSTRRRAGCSSPPGGRCPTRTISRPAASSSSSCSSRSLRTRPVAPHVRLGRRVVAVSRRGFDKVKSAGRDAAPFELVVARRRGRVERVLARAVIDASGTWYAANPMGAGGLRRRGRGASTRDRIRYGIPDVRGRERAGTPDGGRSWSAAGTPRSTRSSTWRRSPTRLPAPRSSGRFGGPSVGLMFGGGGQRPARGAGRAGSRLQALVDSGRVRRS